MKFPQCFVQCNPSNLLEIHTLRKLIGVNGWCQMLAALVSGWCQADIAGTGNTQGFVIAHENWMLDGSKPARGISGDAEAAAWALAIMPHRSTRAASWAVPGVSRHFHKLR